MLTNDCGKILVENEGNSISKAFRFCVFAGIYLTTTLVAANGSRMCLDAICFNDPIASYNSTMLNSKYSEYANQIKQLNSLKKEAVVCEPSFLGVPQPSLEVTTKSGYDATVRFKAAIGSAGEHYRVGLIELRLPGSFTAEQVEKLHEEKAREFGFNKKGAKFSGALGFRSDAKIQLEGAPSPVALSLVSHYIAGNLMITISHSTIFDRKLFAQQSGCLKVIPRI